ncbi:centromere protein P-like [Physella acuta]|uniref:centromere protein P-like n=1 Tax=Physella acuta TaxID=109671 RepID=UPI0027DD72AF|nr:centromere protein P-like [Physella acuta]
MDLADFEEYPDISALSKEELDEFQKKNAETIAELEKDIKLLKRKFKQFGPGALPSPELRLHETMKLTGVTIENIRREVLELDDNHCTKEFYLDLQVLDRKVILIYKLLEIFNPVEGHSEGSKLLWFEIKFGENINGAIGGEIVKAADNLAIHSTISLLKTYLQWQKTQDHAIEKFTKSYPNNVSVIVNERGNRCLEIKNPKPFRPVFTLEWGRKFVNDRVVPDFHLTVQAHEKLVAADTKNILASSPEVFQTMLGSLGADQAIETLIKVVATDGVDVQGSQEVKDNSPPLASSSQQ